VFTIRQDKNGKPSILIEMLPGSNRRPEIKVIENPAAPKTDETKKPEAKKVDPDKLELIKVPDVSGANP